MNILEKLRAELNKNIENGVSLSELIELSQELDLEIVNYYKTEAQKE